MWGGGRPGFFPVRPPLRISNGIALSWIWIFGHCAKDLSRYGCRGHYMSPKGLKKWCCVDRQHHFFKPLGPIYRYSEEKIHFIWRSIKIRFQWLFSSSELIYLCQECGQEGISKRMSTCFRTKTWKLFHFLFFQWYSDAFNHVRQHQDPTIFCLRNP